MSFFYLRIGLADSSSYPAYMILGCIFLVMLVLNLEIEKSLLVPIAGAKFILVEAKLAAFKTFV